MAFLTRSFALWFYGLVIVTLTMFNFPSGPKQKFLLWFYISYCNNILKSLLSVHKKIVQNKTCVDKMF